MVGLAFRAEQLSSDLSCRHGIVEIICQCCASNVYTRSLVLGMYAVVTESLLRLPNSFVWMFANTQSAADEAYSIHMGHVCLFICVQK